jgi:hypothetical protein
MPNIIQHKRSSTPGTVPLATGLAQGELGINIGDGKLYTKNSSNVVINLGITSISGTSITPASGNFSNSLRVNGTGVSISGHTHLISDITNFSISGGYDISVTNNSGLYTIASTNLVHTDSQQPQGFVNRADSRISVSGNIFRIEPTGSSYSYYNKGVKVVKTSGDSLTIPNLTQINYIHFDTTNNQLSNKTTSFDFSSDIPIAYVAWNSGVGPSGQMTFFAEERHGIVMDTSTHKWIHYTFGAQYVEGLSISDYVLGGNGSSNSHATISIGNGTLYQEDIEINITDSSSSDPFCQELSPIAQIPVYYHQGSTGQWVKNTATNYPVKYGANGPQYNLLSGGTWSTPDVSPGGATRYFAVWILATNQIDDPIISIMGQRIDSNQGSAESNNSWSDVNLTNLPLSEVKPLYRLIFAGDSDYTNVPKCTLLSILDIRVAVISTIAGVTQNDHGNLFGLGDDDHSQYLHLDNARTVNAIHNFANGLTVNGTVVSVSGHTHTTSDITNFNSSVSGLISGIYAPLSSPALIGIPTVPTATSGTNTTQIASTSFVRTEISNLVSAAPATLDTLNELAAALGNDANFSTTITNNLASKANLGGATFTGSISGPSGNFTSLKVNNVDVSANGHTHTSSNITDFNSSVSGLIPVKNISNGSYINVSSTTGNYTISATGLQPSGNYSLTGHTHTVSDITNFNSSVSGLLPTISNSGDNRVLTSTGSTLGIDAESNLTFNGSLLTVTGSGLFSEDIRSSGSFIGGSGTALLPSFEFVNDPDTGLFSPAANTFGISTSGVERLRVDSSGNIGIGTSSPTYKLQVNGNFGATTKSFRIHHPSKKDHSLEYGSLESPYHGVRLTGRDKVIKGVGVVSVPDYLKDLIHDDHTLNIQITNIKHGKTIYVDKIDLQNDRFIVKVDRAKTLGNLEFFWTLSGVRKDVDHLVVEKRN